DVDLRIVEHLLNAGIRNARDGANAFEQIGGVGIVGRLIVADDLNIDRRRQSEIQDLGDDVGGQERKRRARKFLRQKRTQRFDDALARRVILLERNERIAILWA